MVENARVAILLLKYAHEASWRKLRETPFFSCAISAKEFVGVAARFAVFDPGSPTARPHARQTPGYFRNAGIFSPAIICSKVSRALINSNALPFTSTSAAIPRVLYRLDIVYPYAPALMNAISSPSPTS
jgi:hypothetical protein